MSVVTCIQLHNLGHCRSKIHGIGIGRLAAEGAGAGSEALDGSSNDLEFHDLMILQIAECYLCVSQLTMTKTRGLGLASLLVNALQGISISIVPADWNSSYASLKEQRR